MKKKWQRKGEICGCRGKRTEKRGAHRTESGGGGGNSSTVIKVLYTNAQSVIKKIVVVLIKRPEIVALTETWTQGDIDNSSLKLDGYEIIDRRDRTDTAARRGGGIGLYAKSEINACKKDVLTNFTQCACLTIKSTQRLAHNMAKIGS